MDYSLPDKRKFLENYCYFPCSIYEATKQAQMGFTKAIISSNMKVMFYVKDIYEFEIEAEIEKLKEELVDTELILSQKLKASLSFDTVVKVQNFNFKAFFNKKYPSEIYLLKIW